VSTPEPPESEKRAAPGQPAGEAAGGQPGSEHATPGPAGSQQPASHQPAAGSAEPVNPAAAQTAVASGGGAGRGARPRRRWPWVTAAVLVGLVLLAVGFAAGRATGRWHDRAGWFERGHHWNAHSRVQEGPRGWISQQRIAAFGHGPGRGPARANQRGPALAGTVSSVDGANVVVNADGGAPVTVTTGDRTKVVGEQRHAVGDLKAGDRVLVRGQVGRPAGRILVSTARARGTVTALDGDRATLTRPNGLTQVVDMAALSAKPKVGDRVVVRGAMADNGATLRAQSVRVLPKTN
jgi:hypothetical protein